MKRCDLYLRTSADDRDKAGIRVQRDGCNRLASCADFDVVREFVDGGVSGTVPMDLRPQGASLLTLSLPTASMRSSLGTVNAFDADQPVFWAFIHRDYGTTAFTITDLPLSFPSRFTAVTA